MRRRRRGRLGSWTGRSVAGLLVVPVLYLLAALIGSTVPVNRGWTEPRNGTNIYIGGNGFHADLIMPVRAEGLDWATLIPPREISPRVRPGWIAIGTGEQRVYLDTPTWWDLTPRTLWSALAGGKRVLHVEYLEGINSEVRAIRLRPEEYRRLWAAVGADFERNRRGRRLRIDHPGYGPNDAFYHATGKASAIHTCNSWVADKLRLAGVKTSLWSPFEQGLLWRYRRETWLRLL